MTLLDIFTHTTIVIQKVEAELRGIIPKRLNWQVDIMGVSGLIDLLNLEKKLAVVLLFWKIA